MVVAMRAGCVAWQHIGVDVGKPSGIPLPSTLSLLPGGDGTLSLHPKARPALLLG